MEIVTKNKSENLYKNRNSNVFSLQKAKRGDLWFLLTFLIPLSIIPVTLNFQNTQHSYFFVNWIFMQIDLANNFNITFFYPFYPIFLFGQDIYYNLVVFLEIICLIGMVISYKRINIKGKSITITSRHMKIPLIPKIQFSTKHLINFFFIFILLQYLNYLMTFSLPGQTFYTIAMLTQAYLFTIAIVIRINQYIDKKNGKFIESGAIGLIASIIVILQIIKFFFSNLYVSEFFYETNHLSWDVKGASITNSVFTSILLFPFPFLNDFLGIIGFTNVDYPFTFSLRIFSISLGVVIPLLWAYSEYKAFPHAFSIYFSKFFRYIIIIIFVLISTFPLMWMILVSFNNNYVLKQGLPIWPFAHISSTLDAWRSFAQFTINPGHNSTEAILFTALTLVTIFLGLISIYKRKSFSAYFERILSTEYRTRIIDISWFILIVIQLTIIIISRAMLEEIYKVIRYNINESNIIRILLENVNKTLIIDYGSLILFNIFLPIFLIYIFLVIVGLIATKGKYWLLFEQMKRISGLFNLINILFMAVISIGIILLNFFVLFTTNIKFAERISFQNIIWFDLLWLILLVISIYTTLPRRRMRLIGTFEGFYLEDGFPFTLTIIFWSLAIYFGILADNAYNWMYLQHDTQILFPVGDWFFITISLCTSVSLISIILASLSGYALSRYQFYGRGLIGGMILSTQIFPGVILVLPMLIIFTIFGLTGSLFGLGVAYSVIALPFVTYLLKGFFDSIPKDLEEQAMIDGCTRMQAYRKIVLPLVLPGIASTFIFSFLAMYTEYLFALIIYQGTTANFTISLAMLRVFQADLTQRGVYYNEMAVFAILVSLPVLFLFTYLQRYLLKGLVAGGMKG